MSKKSLDNRGLLQSDFLDTETYTEVDIIRNETSSYELQIDTKIDRI